MRFMLGIDEAGRGPLAGPVSVGVVAVAEGFDVAKEFPGVADSKAISEKKREKVFEMLEARVALGDARYRVEFGSEKRIDDEGIAVVIRSLIADALNTLAPLEANHRGMVGSTSFAPLTGRAPDSAYVEVLLDGALRAPAEYRQQTIQGGDATVPLISLASIAAKVTRDRLMLGYDEDFPQYGFAKHKGYGTKYHYAMLLEHGPCVLHRRSYL